MTYLPGCFLLRKVCRKANSKGAAKPSNLHFDTSSLFLDYHAVYFLSFKIIYANRHFVAVSFGF